MIPHYAAFTVSGYKLPLYFLTVNTNYTKTVTLESCVGPQTLQSLCLHYSRHCQAVHSDKRQNDDLMQATCAVYNWYRARHPCCGPCRTLDLFVNGQVPLHTCNNSVQRVLVIKSGCQHLLHTLQ